MIEAAESPRRSSTAAPSRYLVGLGIEIEMPNLLEGNASSGLTLRPGPNQQ